MTTARTELPRPSLGTSFLGGSNVAVWRISNSVDGEVSHCRFYHNEPPLGE